MTIAERLTAALHQHPGGRTRRPRCTGGATAMTGADLIAAERHRQIEVEGYDPERDAPADELALAGAAYAIHNPDRVNMAHEATLLWPWSREAYKPTGDRVRDLTKAGALIAAAIDAALRDAARAALEERR